MTGLPRFKRDARSRDESADRGRGSRAAAHDAVREAREVVARGGRRMTDDTRASGSSTRRCATASRRPVATMTLVEKLEVARQLARLRRGRDRGGVPGVVAGRLGRGARDRAESAAAPTARSICGLARANERDIDRCADAVRPAARRRIHIFLATSDVHIKHKLRMTRSAGARAACPTWSPTRAALCDDVEFSPEDATRSDRAFLYEVLTAARRSRRDDAQRAGHRRLLDARRVRRADRRRARPRRARSRRRHLGALPRRSRPRGRELARRSARRRAGRWSAPSTASASAPGTRRWRRS